MKLFILILSLFVGVLGFSQDIIYKFGGVITNTDLNKKEAGVSVTLMKDGKQVASGVSGSNGKYSFSYTGPIASKFVVVYSKAGLVSKRLSFDGAKMNIEDVLAGSEVPLPGDVSMFAERPGVDFSFLNTEPFAVLSWDPNQMGVVPDMAALNKMKKKIDDLLAKAPAVPNEDDAKFTEAVKAGDALFGQKKYQEAIVKFELANSIKPKEKYPTDKILECEKLLAAEKKEQMAAQQADQEYTNLVKAGDNLRDQKKYDDAIAKYNEAIKKKSTDPYPSQQIAAINKLKEEEKNKAAQETKIKELVAAGDKAVTGNKLEEAKAKYEEALALKQDPAVKTKLDDVNKKIADLNAKNQAKAKYDGLIAEATSLQSSGKLAEAKAKYQEAGKLDPTQSVPPAKVKEIDDLIAKGAADKQKTDKYNAAITAAEQLQSTGKLKEAKLKYQEAATIDANQAIPKQKIAEIDNLIANQTAEADKKAKVDKLLTEGAALLVKNDLVNSKLKYEEVLKLEASNSVAQTKINEINTKQNALKGQAEKDKQFEQLKTEGFKLVTEKKWTEAKSKLEEAKTIKADPSIDAKLKEIEAGIKANEGQAQLEKDYSKLLADAEGLLAAKNYDGAIAKYKEAQAKKPTETLPKSKIAEIEELKKNAAGQAQNDTKYKALMAEGDKLVVAKNYVEAIKKFNEALALKPSEKEPVDKAKAAEALAKDQGSEEKKNYEKIFTVVEKAIEDKDYTKAKGLIERAKELNKQLNVVPNDKRPDELLARINSLELAEKQYKEKIVLAESSEKLKDYKKAISLYEEAKKIKPTETIPQQKIDELSKLLAGQTSDAEKNKLYTEAMLSGDKLVKEKKYKDALASYQKALSVKEGDNPAKTKISEVQQLIDNQASLVDNSGVKKAEYEKYIKTADELFQQKNYLEAKKSYEMALTAIVNDKYATKQIIESDRLIREGASVEKEKAYKEAIKVADNSYKSKDYLNAKENYNKALAVKVNDPYATKKLKELDVILNSSTSSDIKLKPLGDPIDNNLIDGMAALNKAEQERQKLEKAKLSEGIKNSNSKEEALTVQKQDEHFNDTRDMFNAQTKVDQNAIKQDENRQGAVNDLSILNKENEKTEIDANKFENNDNLQSQDRINVIQKEHQEIANQQSTAAFENGKEIKSYNNTNGNNLFNSDNKELDENRTSDQKVRSIQLESILNPENDDEQRKNAKISIETKDIKSSDDFVNTYEEKMIRSQKAEKDIDVITNVMTEKEFIDSKRAPNLSEEVKKVDKNVNEIQISETNKDRDSGIESSTQVSDLVNKIAVESVLKDDNRLEAVETLKSTEKNQNNSAFEKSNSENDKYQNGKKQIEDEKKKEDLSEKKDAEAITKANENLHSSKIIVDENSNKATEGEKVNVSLMQDLTKSMTDEQIKDGSSQEAKHNNAQIALNEKHKEPDPKPIAKNALGSQYPEGVSQESFTQNDKNGLMTAIVTRRIVVIEGKGTVYVRTQTLQATTYSKNDQPITEYIWQKETQGSNLKRNY